MEVIYSGKYSDTDTRLSGENMSPGLNEIIITESRHESEGFASP